MIYRVSDLIACLNQTLDYAYPTVEVEGEVSEYKVSQGKWVYFSLKDQDGTLKCFMPVWQLRTPIEDGMVIIVKAVPKITKWGNFSLTVNSLKLAGEGDIKKSFDLLKAKLLAEGLFDVSRKRLLPTIPSHIAVISSIQAAGYADFIKIINERWGGVKVDIANTQVQGEAAADQIIRAISFLNQQEKVPQVIVIIRGGGSADDLSTFNDEKLVRAIAGSRVPTLVGVGHETDETLAGLVADVNASTPSNAAQIVLPDKYEFIRANKTRLTNLIVKFDNVIERQLSDNELALLDMLKNFGSRMNLEVDKLANARRLISQLNPDNILKKGYGILRGRLTIGEIIEIESINKIIKAEVKDVKSR